MTKTNEACVLLLSEFKHLPGLGVLTYSAAMDVGLVWFPNGKCLTLQEDERGKLMLNWTPHSLLVRFESVPSDLCDVVHDMLLMLERKPAAYSPPVEGL